jgi:hypothetical protein
MDALRQHPHAIRGDSGRRQPVAELRRQLHIASLEAYERRFRKLAQQPREQVVVIRMNLE